MSTSFDVITNDLIYFGGVEMISPWKYDEYREGYHEDGGSYEDFDRDNYARNQPL